MANSSKKDARDYCRLCFTSTKKSFKPIDEETRGNFFSLTNVELLESNFYSNLICLQCDKKVKDTREYRDSIRNNELRLIAQLPESQRPVVKSHQTEVIEAVYDPIPHQNPIDDPIVDQIKDEPPPSASTLVFVDAAVCDLIKEEKESSSLVICEVKSAYEETAEVPPVKPPPIRNPEVEELLLTVPGKKLSKVQCPKCDKILVKKSLRGHLLIHFRPEVVKPEKYVKPKKFVPYKAEINEIYKNTPGTKYSKVPCPKCDKTVTKKHLRSHLQLHFRNGPYICDLCGNKLINRDCFKRHLREHLSKPVTCPYGCGQTFLNKMLRKAHEAEVHKDHRRFVCEFCAMRFKVNCDLMQHIAAIHEGKRVKCPYENCEASYSDTSGLKNHVINHHEVEKETCTICGVVVNKGPAMKRHMDYNHAEPKYECRFCHKKYRRKMIHRNHEKMHTNTRDFVCHLCDAKFHIKCNLKRHIREKHQKQKFYCEIERCGSDFINKINLRTHIRTVHKDLTKEETEKYLENVTKMQPKFLMEEGELDEEEQPKRGRSKNS